MRCVIDPATVVFKRVPPNDPASAEELRLPRELRLVVGIGIVLACYTTLAGWFHDHNVHFGVGQAVDVAFATPLQINPRLAFFGMALLLVAAGYAIGQGGGGASGARFVTRQAARLLPLTVAASIVMATQTGIRANGPAVVPYAPVLLGLLAAGGLAWLGYTLLGHSPWATVAGQITACSVVLSVVEGLPDDVEPLVGGAATTTAVVVLGQVMWLVRTRHMQPWVGLLLGVVCWLIFTQGARMGLVGEVGDNGPLTLVYAGLICTIAVQVRGPDGHGKVSDWLTARCYSVVLTAPLVVAVVLPVLSGVPADVAAILALVALGVVAEALYWLLDAPAQWLANALAPATRGSRRR